ncbi:methionyl-tRNA formyltransferase, mitochondrial isoform X1 [Amblyraja radiata]|uniref:methionyl-tRNA formyltransferase, mitochondrial isoform X1 n=1 Tax=Amblyraja radiata TaxID=386614 RepID=UPI0014021935|nr:methionyl-tRNA formyltransferase, mitochondrial isoform X1 [Amblyraja radiata]
MWNARAGRAWTWAAAPGFPRARWTVKRLLSVSSSVDGRRIRAAPPWRILFFGTDAFAQRTLQKLHGCRSLDDGKLLIEQLEVVTLPTTKSDKLPVRKYAKLNQISIHNWPCLTECNQFDVGIIVSFGALLSDALIQQFPYGILNLHPSLLPRWRGPAPIFHTLIHGDRMAGVTIMQIRPKRFDVGPILMQQECPVPPRCTSGELGVILAEKGAEMLLSVLKSLPEHIENKREQSKDGITFAPKITVADSWVNWEEQTVEELDRLNRAIGSRVLLRTLWMGKTVKLMDLVDVEEIPDFQAATQEQLIPGTAHFHKESNILLIRCKNGWTGFKRVVLKKLLSAADFYNGYLHPYYQRSPADQNVAQFQTYTPKTRINKMSK